MSDAPAERVERPRDDSDPWNAAWSFDTRRLEVMGDSKVVINWINGSWEVKGEEHTSPVREMVSQFVRFYLGKTVQTRMDETEWCRNIFENQTKPQTHMQTG